jgi:hypothetical protein
MVLPEETVVVLIATAVVATGVFMDGLGVTVGVAEPEGIIPVHPDAVMMPTRRMNPTTGNRFLMKLRYSREGKYIVMILLSSIPGHWYQFSR